MNKQNAKEIQQDLRRFREYMQETLTKVAQMETILNISDVINWEGDNVLSYEKYQESRLKALKTDIATSLSYLVEALQPIQGDFEHVFEKLIFEENKEEY